MTPVQTDSLPEQDIKMIQEDKEELLKLAQLPQLASEKGFREWKEQDSSNVVFIPEE